MSANKASDNKISEDKPDHMPDKALARDIQNRASCHVGMTTTEMRHFREFLGTSVLLLINYGSCSRGTPSSQRVATQSICFGLFTS